MHLTGLLRSRARDERGFTMLTVITVIFCVTLLSAAALSAAQNDLKPGSHDKERKVAYAAAEAGVQNYVFHLAQDDNYWARCTTGALPNAVSDPWNGTLPDTRRWMSLPGSSARYTIELLPANGASACATATPDATVIDTDTGTFKIRATGESTATHVRRSIIATFKRQSLLDFLYLTDKETRGPELYAMQVPSPSSKDDTNPARDLAGWAAANCDRYWGNDPTAGNRGAQDFAGTYVSPADNSVHHFHAGCAELGFNSGELISGPIHTNDELLIDCTPPPPQLGDSIDDAIETSSLGQTVVTPADPKGGFRMCAGAEPVVNFPTTTTPVTAGTSKPRSPALALPLTNSALLADATPAYRFKGTTKITMHDTTMTVTGTRMAAGSPPLVNVDMAIPADGVVYVANNGSCTGYTPTDSAAAPSTCGNLELQGDYAANVTFGAENDIVVMDDLQRTSSSSAFLLGLIATGYVRVSHPVTGCNPASWPGSTPTTCNSVSGCTNAPGTPTDVTIEAAILSLTRSFIVDNWFCGAKLGTLHVFGAVAQKFRGPVYSVTPAGTESGYDKSYAYDSKLRHRSPPYFLDPVNAQWRVETFTEQLPAR